MFQKKRGLDDFDDDLLPSKSQKSKVDSSVVTSSTHASSSNGASKKSTKPASFSASSSSMDEEESMTPKRARSPERILPPVKEKKKLSPITIHKNDVKKTSQSTKRTSHSREESNGTEKGVQPPKGTKIVIEPESSEDSHKSKSAVVSRPKLSSVVSVKTRLGFK